MKTLISKVRGTRPHHVPQVVHARARQCQAHFVHMGHASLGLKCLHNILDKVLGPPARSVDGRSRTQKNNSGKNHITWTRPVSQHPATCCKVFPDPGQICTCSGHVGCHFARGGTRQTHREQRRLLAAGDAQAKAQKLAPRGKTCRVVVFKLGFWHHFPPEKVCVAVCGFVILPAVPRCRKEIGPGSALSQSF